MEANGYIGSGASLLQCTPICPQMREESLQAWFDANDSSTINTNFVKKWKDQANENEFSQTELLKRPAFIENALNNLPVIDLMEMQTHSK